MPDIPHEIIRTTTTWGTYGKNGDEPLKEILIKDISDEHLENIIGHIFNNFGAFTQKTLIQMKREEAYRIVHGISVPPYFVSFKFFHKNK